MAKHKKITTETLSPSSARSLRRKHAIFIAAGITVVALIVLFDYWCWLGCPRVDQMILTDGYPGHGLTAHLRHEDYYVDIPHSGMGYSHLLETYGSPQSVEITDSPSNPDTICLDAVFAEFAVHCVGDRNEDIDEYHVVHTIITSDAIPLTRSSLRVGNSRLRILYQSRYYTSHIKAEELEPGFDWGYIDGSGLTLWTWVEFQFDQTDHVSSILVWNPW